MEILAGVSTFLALSYIFIVNPAILSQAGMNPDAVLFATIATSALATLAMGLWARLPFALAPGMEMNAYVAFFVVGTLGFTWQQALGAVFWSGVAFVVLTVSRVRERIIAAIPDRMKGSLSLSVGIFLILIALRVAGLLRYDGIRIAGLGEVLSPLALAFLLSAGLAFLLDHFRVRAAILVSVVATAIVCEAFGIGVSPAAPAAESTASAGMFAAVGQANLGVIADPRIFSVILVLFLIDFYGSVAKLIGLSARTSIALGGTVPRLKEALAIDGVATIGGAGLGTSSLTVYVESGVGIGVGGRTGLTALTCGILMLACAGLAPFLHLIPPVAASGALVWVGVKLCPSLRELRDYPRVDLAVLVVMPAVVAATFALDLAMLAGLSLHVASALLSRRHVNPYLLASAALLAAGAFLQFMVTH